MVGILWLSEAGIKIINPNFNNFVGLLNGYASVHPEPFIQGLIQNLLVPNGEILVYFVIMTELFIAFSLFFGFLTRLGAIIGMVMSFNLWILTMGAGEWIWTYPLIFAPFFIFFFSDTSHQIGIDRRLNTKFKGTFLKYL